MAKINVSDIREIRFNRVHVTAEDWQDATCSQCGKSWYFSNRETETRDQFRGCAYIYKQDSHGGLQLCEECFNKLD